MASQQGRQPRRKSTIPAFPNPRYYRLLLFTEADWDELEAVGRPAAQPSCGPNSVREQELIRRFARLDDPGRRRAEVASKLNQAFEAAAWHAAHDAAVPKPSVHAEQFANVAKKAVELLRLLRLNDRGELADRTGRAQHPTVRDPWHLWLMRGAPPFPWPVQDETAEQRATRLAALEPFLRTATLAQRVLSPGAVSPCLDDTLQATLGLTDASLTPEDRASELEIAYWHIGEALKVVPAGLALLAQLAERVTAVPITPSASPEFDHTFRELLFFRLASIYVTMFGTAPVCWQGRHEDGNEGPAAMWAENVLFLADQRTSKHLLPDGVLYRDKTERKRALNAIEDLARSKTSTFARRMEKAWSDHSARDQARERSRASSRE